MLFLYPKNTIDFTNNGDPIHHSYDEHVIRDDGFYLTFSLLLDKEEGYKKVKKEMIVGANTPDGPNQFRVYDVKKKNTHVEVTAVQLMYDFDNKEVNPFSIKNATGNQVITKFRSSFKSSLGQFTMDSSVSELHDFATNEAEDDTPSHNALEILNRITSRWDSELMLNGFDIRMIKRLGQKTDALLYEKKNISEFEDSSSVSGMATRIHATSKFTPEGRENEVTLSVTVDSPLINDYAQIYEKSFVNNECRTEAELIAWVKLKYSTENIDKPSRSITVATNIIDGTEINYGDDLVLKYLVHDVDEVIRCVGYDYDPIRKTYYSVTLGDWKDSFFNTITSNIVDSTNKQFNQLKNNITYVSMSANGKNRNAYGPEPVPNPINGDQWYYYELNRPNDVELRVYQDGFWVKFDFFATKNEVEGALTEAEEAKQEAIESYNNALADAANYTNTKAQEFDTKLLAVNQEVVNAKQSANAAVAKADKAIQDVGFMQVDINVAKANAATALESSNTAKSNASTALTNANSALTKVGALEVTTGSLQTSYNELTKTVGLKADKTTVDGINSKVTQHGLYITANATAVGLKADKAVVDTLKGTVDKHTLDIKAAADGLTLKADSSLVNTIKGTVDTHTNQISVNSQAINARLTETQVNTLLSGKNYVNETTLNATSNGLSALITQVSNDLAGLEIGGRNYILDSKEQYRTPSSNDYNYHTYQISSSIDSSNKHIITGQIEVTAGTTNKITLLFWNSSSANVFSANPTFDSNGYFEQAVKFWGTPNRVLVYIGGSGTTANKGGYIRELNLVSGNKKTDWSPAPEDMATLEKVVSIEANINGLQTTVADKADKTQVTQLSNQWTQTTNLVNGHTTQISSLGTQINLRVTSGQVTEAILADKTIKDTRHTNESPLWYIANYPKQKVEEFKYRGTIGVPGNSSFVKLTTDTPWSGTSGGIPVQTATSSDGTYQRKSNGSASTWLAWEKIIEAGELISQINIQTGNIIIQTGKLYLDTTSTHMTTAYVNDLKAKSIEAVYADIATLKTKVLTADVITSTMVKSDIALVDKIFATDANVSRLTAKTAFINSVKAIDITADRITTGTLNAANVAIINLNANRIVTGTVSGANSAWNLNTGLMTFTNPSTNDMLQLTQGQIQFQNGVQTRLLQYNAEGLQVLPGSGNTGTSRNTALHLIGGGVGSYQYIQFVSGNGVSQRLETVDDEMILYHGNTGAVHVRRYYDNHDYGGKVIAAKYETRHSTGVSLIIAGNSIETPRNGAMPVYIRPQGTGSVIAGDASGTRFNMVASDFVKQSSRTTKTNIVPLQGGLDVIRSLTPVSYNKIDKLNQGIYEIEKGFISEDSPMVATPDGLGIYDSHITAHLVKAVQELDQKVISIETVANASNAFANLALNNSNQALSETQQLKEKVAELENKIKQMESAT